MNLFAPKGFHVSRHLSGGTAGRMNEYTIPSGLAEDIYIGDAVKSDGNGGIQLCAAGETMLGIFQGVKFVDPNGGVRFGSSWAAGQVILAGTVCLASVIDDPDVLLVAQTSGSLTQADVGQLVDLDASVAGSSAFGRSGMAVADASAAGTQFRIVRLLHPVERNGEGLNAPVEAGLNAVVELAIANHEHRAAQVAPASTEQ